MASMDWLADLFETNRIIVLSVYGQVFFVLGLAVALQSRKRSELALARPLAWLAAFGITHALTEWGYLFVPIQAGFLPQAVIEALLVLQLALKGLSFALLLQFGAELLLSVPRPSARPDSLPRGPFGQPWLRLAPTIVGVLWIAGTLGTSAMVGSFAPDPSPWLRTAEVGPAIASVGAPLAVGDVLARAMLALPGAVLAVIGLRRTQRSLGPLAAPPVGWALRAAAVAFAIYALLAGLIGMPAPFPPASVVNSTVVAETLGLPIEVLRSLAGLAMAVAVIRSLELFEQETDRILAQARRRELLLRERQRIGRDLHDGVIQSIYAAGLHLEQAAADEAVAPAGRERVASVLAELNRITDDIRSTIFDLRSGAVEGGDVEEIVTAVAEELRANTLLPVDLHFGGARRARLTADQAEQLHHLVTEALSNVLRHARASRVSVRVDCDARQLAVEIADDGVGFDPPAEVGQGAGGRAQGIENIRRRAELLGGRVEIRSAPGQGTAVSLTMPVASTVRSA
jgi:signal transduction histidine kinase